MRRTIAFTVIVLLLAGWLGAAAEVDSAKVKGWMDADAERPDSAGEGEVLVGYHDVSTDGAVTRAGEYESLEDNPHLIIDLMGAVGEKGLVILDATAWDSDDGEYFFRVEPNRALRFDVEYNRFPHNLPHDPLTNLEAVNEIKVVEHTDFEPDAQYSIRHSEGKVALRGKAPGAPGLHYSLGYREQSRKGTQQSMTTGKCYSCHTYSQTRIVDEKTRDLTGVIGYEGKSWSLQYEFLGRRFEERGQDPTVTYDKAFRPNNPNLLVFEDRIQYDQPDGVLPYDAVPDSEKQTHTFKGHWTNKAGGTLSGAFVTSKVENEETGLQSDYGSGRLRYYHTWNEGKVGLNLGYRHEEIDNDDVFVNVNEREAVMGPYVGNTYLEVWGPGGLYGGRGAVTDFLRESALDRTVQTADVGLRLRLAHRHTLRLDYTYRATDRDHYYVTDAGGTETKEHRFRAMLLGRPAHEWRYRIEAEYQDIQDPFVNVNGGCQEDAESVYGTAGVSGSPLLSDSLQYYELHELRRADIGPLATEVLNLEGNVTWKPSWKTSVTATGRYTDRKNTQTETTDWDSTDWMVGLSLWFAPDPHFYGTLSYNHLEDENTTPICVPILDA